MDNALTPQLIRSLFHIRQTLVQISDNLDLPAHELIALSFLSKNRLDSDSNVFASDLQDRLFISKSAISQMLNLLEKKGYIKREFNESNRRKIIITLTPEGRSTVESSQGRFVELMDNIIGEYGESKIKELLELLEQFSTVVDRIIEDGDFIQK